jgi:hypothetical protein
VKDDGDQIDYGMRVYDSRLGRFMSVDPITKKYPELTPYQYASNTPVAAIDIDGLEGMMATPGTIYASNKNLYDDLLAGRNTPRVQNSKKAGKVIAIAGALALDIVLTKGRATQLLLTSQVAGAFYHNKASTPEGRELQDESSKAILTDAFITWGTGRIIGSSISIFKGLLRKEVKYFFRGTSEGFEGNKSHQDIGVTPTSSDPVVATIIGIESNNYGKGVLHIALPKDLQGVAYMGGQGLENMEREIGLAIKPIEFAEKAEVTISSEQARGILKKMGIDLPRRIQKIDITPTIKNTRRLTETETEMFYLEALKLNKK